MVVAPNLQAGRASLVLTLFDSGSDADLISQSFVERSGLQQLVTPLTAPRSIVGLGGSFMVAKEEIKLDWTFSSKSPTLPLRCYLIDMGLGEFDLLLGRVFLYEHKILVLQAPRAPREIELSVAMAETPIMNVPDKPLTAAEISNFRDHQDEQKSQADKDALEAIRKKKEWAQYQATKNATLQPSTPFGVRPYSQYPVSSSSSYTGPTIYRHGSSHSSVYSGQAPSSHTSMSGYSSTTGRSGYSGQFNGASNRNSPYFHSTARRTNMQGSSSHPVVPKSTHQDDSHAEGGSTPLQDRRSVSSDRIGAINHAVTPNAQNVVPSNTSVANVFQLKGPLLEKQTHEIDTPAEHSHSVHKHPEIDGSAPIPSGFLVHRAEQFEPEVHTQSAAHDLLPGSASPLESHTEQEENIFNSDRPLLVDAKKPVVVQKDEAVPTPHPENPLPPEAYHELVSEAVISVPGATAHEFRDIVSQSQESVTQTNTIVFPNHSVPLSEEIAVPVVQEPNVSVAEQQHPSNLNQNPILALKEESAPLPQQETVPPPQDEHIASLKTDQTVEAPIGTIPDAKQDVPEAAQVEKGSTGPNEIVSNDVMTSIPGDSVSGQAVLPPAASYAEVLDDAALAPAESAKRPEESPRQELTQDFTKSKETATEDSMNSPQLKDVKPPISTTNNQIQKRPLTPREGAEAEDKVNPLGVTVPGRNNTKVPLRQVQSSIESPVDNGLGQHVRTHSSGGDTLLSKLSTPMSQGSTLIGSNSPDPEPNPKIGIRPAHTTHNLSSVGPMTLQKSGTFHPFRKLTQGLQHKIDKIENRDSPFSRVCNQSKITVRETYGIYSFFVFLLLRKTSTRAKKMPPRQHMQLRLRTKSSLSTSWTRRWTLCVRR
jgi:hypothetical protein